jgi:hypothetical protein
MRMLLQSRPVPTSTGLCEIQMATIEQNERSARSGSVHLYSRNHSRTGDQWQQAAVPACDAAQPGRYRLSCHW